jgi:hypothetical protein
MEELPCLDMGALRVVEQQEQGGDPKILVQALLWTQICEQLNPAEFDEVKAALGSKLIDGNEVGQLIATTNAQQSVNYLTRSTGVAS